MSHNWTHRLLSTLLIFSPLTLGHLGWAETTDSCTPIRLDAPGMPMENMPVYDQGKTDLCYAYTAAQVVDAWRFSHGDQNRNHLTSPLSAAILYTRDYEDNPDFDDIDLGHPDYTARVILANGSCSPPVHRHAEQEGTLRETLDRIQSLHGNLQGLAERVQRSPLLTAGNQMCTDVSSVVPRNLPELARNIASTMARMNSFEFIDRLYRGYCHNANVRPVQPPAQVKVDSIRALEKSTAVQSLTDSVHLALGAQPPQPAGISYCSEILKDSATRGVDLDDPDGPVTCKGTHASVVIGRRPGPEGRCQLLIRNTWGDSCNVDSKWQCENGNIWIDQDALMKNTYRVFRMIAK